MKHAHFGQHIDRTFSSKERPSRFLGNMEKIWAVCARIHLISEYFKKSHGIFLLVPSFCIDSMRSSNEPEK